MSEHKKHICEDCKKLRTEIARLKSEHTYCQRLKDIIQKTIDLNEKYNENTISNEQFSEQKKQIHDSMADIPFPNRQKSSITRIAKRLARHKNELFTFLDYKRASIS